VRFADVDAEVLRANVTDLLPPPVVPTVPQSRPVQMPGSKPRVG
jgi:phospholipase C